MSFVYPQFLYALLAVLIPVIIHLFNFRRFKKVYFSDIRFLKEVKIQAQHRNRIKHLLLLLTRILAIIFLVLAFAQPFIPLKGEKSMAGTQAVSIFVDNSFSMENVSKGGMLLNEAKKMAREIALAHSQTDHFQLLTNDFEARQQRLVSREEFLTMLDEVKESPAVRKISDVIARQNDLLGKADAKNKKSFLISDFQKSITNFDDIKEDTAVSTVLLPVHANQQNNLYIDSCWFSSPVHQLNQPEVLNVRIKNSSTANLENIPLKLFLNKQQKSPSSFSIDPNSTKNIQLSFTAQDPGIQQGRIEITDYPVTYDDKFYFSFMVEKNITVTNIFPPPTKDSNSLHGLQAIQSLFGKDSLFILNNQDENKIDYTALSTQQLIILSDLKVISSGLAQELSQFVSNGGSLVIFPSPEADTASYKTFLSSLDANFYVKMDTATTKVDYVNFDSEIFYGVFDKKSRMAVDNMNLPTVHSHYTQTHSNHSREEVLLKLKNGDPLFSQYNYKKGKIYISAVPLNPAWSNLTRHAIFVPLMYKIAMNSQPVVNLFYILDKDNSIHVPKLQLNQSYNTSNENIFKIKGDNSSPATKDFEVIPESRIIDFQPVIFVHDQIKEAGNYLLYKGNELLSGLSFNYDRKESDLTQYSPEEIAANCEKSNLKNFSMIEAGNKNVTKMIADISRGVKLWKWCILLVLFFLALETALVRLLK